MFSFVQRCKRAPRVFQKSCASVISTQSCLLANTDISKSSAVLLFFNMPPSPAINPLLSCYVRMNVFFSPLIRAHGLEDAEREREIGPKKELGPSLQGTLRSCHISNTHQASLQPRKGSTDRTEATLIQHSLNEALKRKKSEGGMSDGDMMRDSDGTRRGADIRRCEEVRWLSYSGVRPVK